MNSPLIWPLVPLCGPKSPQWPNSGCSNSSPARIREWTDLYLFGRGQLLSRKGGRLHVVFMPALFPAGAEGRVPRRELLCTLEEADRNCRPQHTQ
jgi:hypothetical protein